MRYLTIFILILTALVSNGQRIYIQYSNTIDPFTWFVSYIEFRPDSAYISVTVKNRTKDPRVIGLNQGVYLYTDKYADGIEGTINSYGFEPNSKTITLGPQEQSSFNLSFPNNDLMCEDGFILKIGRHFVLKDIPIPELTFTDLTKRAQTWGQYYNTHRVVNPTYSNVEEVKNAIRANVENWQKRGEFEPTSAWQERVNDVSRQKYDSEITAKLTCQYENELDLLKNERDSLENEYEAYKNNLIQTYYHFKIARATNSFLKAGCELKRYDADNEVFLIHSNSFGDIQLPVPVAEASSFKQKWDIICRNIKTVYIPNGRDVVLSKLIFNNDGNEYVYECHALVR